MCLIFTILAAIIFTIINAVNKKSASPCKSISKIMFMFWGAALMWCVDGIASVMEGEGFFDLSSHDAILGAIIVTAGLLVFCIMLALEKRQK
ncbi:hypothetical protein MSI_21070 [Treponema sp. JC4]|uniref:hypothetical protein n=1 Tax=Treponema sp. JC4 TaxID=1124982 RepID=UPI00025B0AEB|nr:hypothetical protein [Treponema sp. JC4]EID84412.1 hypothetical protein MSI_21070 [Treponema sp. JC4]